METQIENNNASEAPLITGEAEPAAPPAAPELPAPPRRAMARRKPVSLEPGELLRIAVEQGADLDKLAKLMELQERWEAREARKAFDAALAKFKRNPPTIIKNKKVDMGVSKDGVRRPSYEYADLAQASAGIERGLSKYGLSHKWRFRQEQGSEWIWVTCILTHALGHQEENTLGGVADQTGSKNPLQALSSTVTYLERITLLGSCGMAAKNMDTDARLGILPQTVEEQCKAITAAGESGDYEAVKKAFFPAYQQAASINDRTAMNQLMEAKDKAKERVKAIKAQAETKVAP